MCQKELVHLSNQVSTLLVYQYRAISKHCNNTTIFKTMLGNRFIFQIGCTNVFNLFIFFNAILIFVTGGWSISYFVCSTRSVVTWQRLVCQLRSYTVVRKPRSSDFTKWKGSLWWSWRNWRNSWTKACIVWQERYYKHYKQDLVFLFAKKYALVF